MKRSQIGITPKDAARQARETRARIAFLAGEEIAVGIAQAAPSAGTSPAFAEAIRMLRDEARRREAGKPAALSLPGDEAFSVLCSAGLTPRQASALLDRACLATEAAEERLPADRSIRLLVTADRNGGYEIRRA